MSRNIDSSGSSTKRHGCSANFIVTVIREVQLCSAGTAVWNVALWNELILGCEAKEDFVSR